MTSVEQQKIQDIFDVALQLKSEQRETYIDAVCGEDLVLRIEVEKLLDSYRSDSIEKPAIGKDATTIQHFEKSFLNTKQISHYKIIKQIGKGGMGEIYLAEDINLNRQVALKLLSATLDLDKQHFRRFVREARTASSLNHPNICTIYEINDDENTPFIAMEYIEGETLEKIIRKKGLNFQQILDIVTQVVAALKEAHAAKVVHRDIKPENIMIRPDGLVKVLDFGLAKLTKNISVSDALNSKASTITYNITNPGLVIGTVNYMSPEQAQGKDVDTRTDIFSFGVVLYEMLTGKLPFEGENGVDVLGSILHKEPVPPSQFIPGIPLELENLISKALQKDREERYQTIEEILGQLKDFDKKLDFDLITDETDFLATNKSNSFDLTKNTLEHKTLTHKSIFQTNNTSKKIFSTLKLYTRSSSLKLIVCALVLLVIGVFFYNVFQPSKDREPLQTMRFKKLTSTGNVRDRQISISPDGKYVVYVVQEAEQQSLWVRHVATSGNVQIVPSAEVYYTGLTFSQDGDYIYYAASEKERVPAIYKIPALGGNARKLVADANGPVTLSPDGNQMAFVRKGTSLMIAGSNGGAAQMLAPAPKGDRWINLTWSPDGRDIISSVYSSSNNNYRIVEVSVKEGKIKTLNIPPWVVLTGLMWLSDGSGLILSGRDQETKLSQLWFVSYPDGKLRKITNDLSSYQGLSLTADNKTIVSVSQTLLSNIWTVSDTNTNRVEKITSEVGRDEGLSGIAWSPDGRIVYTTRITGTQDLWIVNQDGSQNQQLTFDVRSNFSPTVSPDGRFIVFASDRTGNVELWRMDLDGNNPKRLTSTSGIAGEPDFSPDGKWIVYDYTDANNVTTVWKMDIDGNNQVQLTTVESGRPTVSPEGNFIACDYGETSSDSLVKIAIIPFDGGLPTKLLDFPLVIESRTFRWSSDGKALIYFDSRDRIFNLWKQPLDGSAPEQLTNLSSDQIYRFDLSNHGNGFALARGYENSDVVLINNFR